MVVPEIGVGVPVFASIVRISMVPVVAFVTARSVRWSVVAGIAAAAADSAVRRVK